MSEDGRIFLGERQCDGTAAPEPESNKNAIGGCHARLVGCSSIQTEDQSEVGDAGGKDHTDHTDPEGLPRYPDLDDPRDIVFVGHMGLLATGQDTPENGARMLGIPVEKVREVVALWQRLDGIGNPRDALRQIRGQTSPQPPASIP